jgi:hypothetical protein
VLGRGEPDRDRRRRRGGGTAAAPGEVLTDGDVAAEVVDTLEDRRERLAARRVREVAAARDRVCAQVRRTVERGGVTQWTATVLAAGGVDQTPERTDLRSGRGGCRLVLTRRLRRQLGAHGGSGDRRRERPDDQHGYNCSDLSSDASAHARVPRRRMSLGRSRRSPVHANLTRSRAILTFDLPSGTRTA